MKLIVGLGNPGAKYAATRHNIGFDVLAGLARRHGVGQPRGKFHGSVVEASIAGEKALLLCPETYMNRSGRSVAAACAFYKLPLEDLMVVCDDFNLSVARLRFRSKGSAGGQKGLQDIIQQLGSDAFSRLRIGIGPPPPQWDVADYVLSKFTPEERADIDDAVARAANSLADWTLQGIDYCMNQYNANEPS